MSRGGGGGIVLWGRPHALQFPGRQLTITLHRGDGVNRPAVRAQADFRAGAVFPEKEGAVSLARHRVLPQVRHRTDVLAHGLLPENALLGFELTCAGLGSGLGWGSG